MISCTGTPGPKISAFDFLLGVLFRVARSLMPSHINKIETQANRSIKTGEDIWARLIGGSPDCIKVLDLDGRLISMNAGGMKLLEICALEPFIGSSWIEFWIGADREAAK